MRDSHTLAVIMDQVETCLPIWSLPWDDVVFSYILPYLDLKSLFVLSGVCKDVRFMVHTYFESMKRVDVQNIGSKLSPVAMKSLLSRVCMCQMLLLKNCKSSLMDSDLEPALERNGRVFHFDVTNCISLSNNVLQTLAVSCSSLRVLILQNCVWVSSEAVSNVALHCNQLEQIDLSGCWHVDDDAITTVSVCCLRYQLPFFKHFDALNAGPQHTKHFPLFQTQSSKHIPNIWYNRQINNIHSSTFNRHYSAGIKGLLESDRP